MNYKEFNKEVLYTTDKITTVTASDIEQLKRMAEANDRKRIRLCCHNNVENTLHEMLIVHAKGAYVPPHKHLSKTESFHMIQGKLQVVIFNEEGHILEVVTMGDYDSNETFFYRLSDHYFHTVIPLSDWVVFHEITNGPFKREDMIFAPWGASENDPSKIKIYINELEEQVSGFLTQASSNRKK